MITQRGLAVAFGTVAAYVAGMVLGYVELFVFAGAGVVAILIGVGWVVVRPNLGVSRLVEPARVQRGDPAIGVLEVTNRSRYPSVAASAEEPCGPVRIDIDIPPLGRGARVMRRYRLPTERRAVLDIGPVSITRQDPLGLFRVTQPRGSVERLWVHPVVHPLVGLPAGRTRSLDGQATDAAIHGSITFSTLREYVIGDDLRRVHWKSSAHTGQLMVREYVDTSLPLMLVFLDNRAEVHDEAGFEEAVEAVASVAVVATRAGFPIRLVTACGRSAGGRGIGADAAPMLDLLASVTAVPGIDLRDAVRSLLLERRGDTFVAVTGAVDAGDLAPVVSLTRRYDDSVIALVCPDAEQRMVGVSGSFVPIRAADAREFARRWNLAVAT